MMPFGPCPTSSGSTEYLVGPNWLSRSSTAHKSTHDVQTIVGFNNENETKIQNNWPHEPRVVLVVSPKNLPTVFQITPLFPYYNFACQSSEYLT